MRLLLLTAAAALIASGCGADSTDDTSSPENIPNTKEEVAELTDIGKADWSLDPCKRWGWYGDGVCDWFCFSHDTDCDAPALFADPRGDATRFPILLAHGFDASQEDALTNRWAFYQVKETLEADGHGVCAATVPPYDSVANRAEHLKEAVDQCLAAAGVEKLNIIAHSMGGLDSRYLISNMGYGDRVASLTMISTAHQGTNVADFILNLTPGVVDPVVNKLAELWGRTFTDLSDDADVRAALVALSEAEAPAFNAANPDDDRVYYQSWAGISTVFGIESRSKWADVCDGKLHISDGTADRMHFTIKPLGPIAAHGLQRLVTDGMVPVTSAKWGDFQGCIPADHMDEVGQYHNEGANEDTGFDHLLWYRTMAYDLAAQGF